MLIIFGVRAKNEKALIFKIAPNDFKFSHMVKIGLLHLFLKFQSISTIFDGVRELYHFRICHFSQLLFHKTLSFHVSLKTLIQSKQQYFVLLKKF